MKRHKYIKQVLKSGVNMRNLVDVIDSLLTVIPDNETELRTNLSSICESPVDATPELAHFKWFKVHDILRKHCYFTDISKYKA